MCCRIWEFNDEKAVQDKASRKSTEILVNFLPPFQRDKYSGDADAGEDDEGDPHDADQDIGRSLCQGCILHVECHDDGNYHHAEGVADGTHGCQDGGSHTVVGFLYAGHDCICIRR